MPHVLTAHKYGAWVCRVESQRASASVSPFAHRLISAAVAQILQSTNFGPTPTPITPKMGYPVSEDRGLKIKQSMGDCLDR